MNGWWLSLMCRCHKLYYDNEYKKLYMMNNDAGWWW
jgi:hypothetical protein